VACWCEGKCPHIAPAQELFKKGRAARGHLALKNILTAAPLCVEANLAMANYLARTNHAAAALVHVDRAARGAPSPRVQYERAAILRGMARHVEAIEAFDAALKLAPENPAISAGYIAALEMGGFIAEARQLADSALTKFPDHPEILRLSAVVADAAGDPEKALAIVSGVAAPTPILFLDRGRYLEKLGRYAEAWASWTEGKRILREHHGHTYAAGHYQKTFEQLRIAATPPRPFFTRRAPEMATDPAPLFVCGFPRSGTTLLETVLGAHSAIIAGDELNGIGDIVEKFPAWMGVRVPYPAAMIAASLGENAQIPGLMRDYYLHNAAERIGFTPAPRAARRSRKAELPRPLFFTDKMPLNELHLPLIRMLFPTAPVLRLQRHPLDVVVSVFSNWLIHGGFYASSLESAATHLRQTSELCDYYRSTFIAADRMGFRDVSYESFVSDPAGELGGILGALKLETEPACLAHHETKPDARTLSYSAVRKPINAGSVGRWKNYAEQLAPAIEILRPVLERGGYGWN
jgi:hypothetical protein